MPVEAINYERIVPSIAEVRVKDFSELHHQFASCIGNRLWLFRGQHDVTWPLVPRFGRPEFKNIEWTPFFESWKRRASEFVKNDAQNEWDWMAIAQHHGLATKLMDWSFNPLVACYFAAYPFKNEDCAVYAYHSEVYVDTATARPDAFKGIIRLRPRGIAGRIVRQAGIFTYHNPASSDLAKDFGAKEVLHRVVIAAEYRKQLIYELDLYGYSRLNLFPDLDGLSEYQNWAAHQGTRAGWEELRTARYKARR